MKLFKSAIMVSIWVIVIASVLVPANNADIGTWWQLSLLIAAVLISFLFLLRSPKKRPYLRKIFWTLRIKQQKHLAKSQKRSVLFITSNGAGLGHLTRLSAISDCLQGAEKRILTLSSGYHKLDFPADHIHYFPSYGKLKMDPGEWNVAFAKNLKSLIAVSQPSLVIFDGNFIYDAITKVLSQRGLPLWWVQRGCWKESVDGKSLQRHNTYLFCNKVIVPRDYGCDESVDFGSHAEVEFVNPIIKNGMNVLISREEALTALGLGSDKRYVLIQLGAGNINNISEFRQQAIKIVRDLGTEWMPVVLKNPLNPASAVIGAETIEAYPISDFFQAFDFAVLAAGYNSVQESVAYRLPAVFVPNKLTSTDDQLRRSRGMEGKGLGLYAGDSDELEESIKKLTEVKVRNAIQEQARLSCSADGAHKVADEIELFLTQLNT